MSGLPYPEGTIVFDHTTGKTTRAAGFLLENLPKPPEPGERCELCNRRKNKPRQNESPDTKEMRIKLPSERMESCEEAFDALQQIVGADPYSYPRGVILEALLLLGGQQREQLKAYFEGTE